MRILILLLLFVVCSSGKIKAQHSIAGQILNEKKEKIDYATIRLLKNDSSFVQGVITDSLGFFTINKVQSGAYILFVSSVGYRPAEVTVNMMSKSQKLPPVILTADNVMLGEVVVKGNSFIRKEDRVLIIPDKKQAKHAGSGYDLLYNLMIPSINVDRFGGKVTTFGGDVTLYIDGRKADYREVQSLRPKDIEKVEYFDVPTGKYADDVASINYVTKKYKTGGYIALDGKQMIGYLNGDYNLVSKVSHGNTNYTFFGGHQMHKYDGTKSDNHESYLFTDYEVMRDYQTLDAKVKGNSQYAQLNVVNSQEKRTLLGTFSLVRNSAPDNYNVDMLKYSSPYDVARKSDSRTSSSGLMPAFELYGNFNLTKKQLLETRIQGSYANNEYTRDYSEGDFSTRTHTTEDLYSVRTSIKYGIQFGHKNSLTAHLRNIYKVSSSQYLEDTISRQHLWTSETILSMQYSQRFGKKVSIQLTPGISSLQYRLRGDELISEVSPRLKVGLTYRPGGNHQLQTNVVVGNSNPSINMLSNVDQVVDLLTVKRGNPNLQITRFVGTTLMYGLQFGQFNVQAAGNYRHYNHLPTDNYFVENDKLIHSFRSDNKAHELAAMIAATWKANDNLRFRVEGNWLRIAIYGGASDALNSWSGLAQVNYYWKDFACSLYGKTPSRLMEINLVHLYEPANYGISLSWNHANWRIEAGTENPFTKRNYREQSLHTDVYNFNNTTTSRTYQQTGYMKIAYIFDFGRKTSRDANNVETNVESAILKAE